MSVTERSDSQVPDLILGLDFDTKMFQIDVVAFHRVVAKIFL